MFPPMESIAQMTCDFKVNLHCDGCKTKVMEVLNNLRGEYSVSIDAEKGMVKVNGKVNPTQILNVFDKYGKHGEVTSLKLDGEVKEVNPLYHLYGENLPFPQENEFYNRNPHFMPPSSPPFPFPLPSSFTMPPPPPPPPTPNIPSAPPLPKAGKEHTHDHCCTIL